MCSSDLNAHKDSSNPDKVTAEWDKLLREKDAQLAEDIALELPDPALDFSIKKEDWTPIRIWEATKSEAERMQQSHQDLELYQMSDGSWWVRKISEAETRLLSQIQEKQTTLAQKQQELNHKQSELDQKTTELEQQRNALSAKNQELDQFNADKANLEERAQLEQQIRDKKQEIQELQRDINAETHLWETVYTSAKKELDLALEQAQKALEQAQKDLADTQKAIDHLEIWIPEGPAERASAKAEEKNKIETNVEEKNKRTENPEVWTKTPEDIDFSSKEWITKLFESVENLDLEQVENICEKAYQQNYVKWSNFNGQWEFILDNSSISYQINYLNGKPCGLRIHDYQNKTKTYYKYEDGKRTPITREDYVNIRSEAMEKCHREINRFNNETPEEISAFLNTLSNTKEVNIVDLEKASNMLEYVSGKDLAQALDVINKAQKRFIESYGDVNSHLYRPKIEAAQTRLKTHLENQIIHANYAKKKIEALSNSKDFEKDSDTVLDLLKNYERLYGKESPQLKELQTQYEKVISTHMEKAVNDGEKELRKEGKISETTDKKLSRRQKVIEKLQSFKGNLSETLQRRFDGLLHLRFYFKLGSKDGVQIGDVIYQQKDGKLLKIDKQWTPTEIPNKTKTIIKIREAFKKQQKEFASEQSRTGQEREEKQQSKEESSKNGAEEQQLKNLYKTLVLKFHPDKVRWTAKAFYEKSIGREMEEREITSFKDYFKDELSIIEFKYNELFLQIQKNQRNKQWLEDLSNHAEQYQNNIFNDLKNKFDDFTASTYQAVA